MEDKVIRSPLKYQGSKLKLIPWIKEVAQFDPAVQQWIEPFLGSGVVALNLVPKWAVVNDINPHVIRMFEMMNENSYFVEGIVATLKSHDEQLQRYGEAYYYKMRDHFNDNFHPNTLLFLNHTCFNGVMRFNKKGKFNVPYGKNDNKLTESYREQLVKKIVDAKEITKMWGFRSGDYREAFENVNGSDLIYLDPPYIDRESGYYGSWTDADERELHEFVKYTKARVVLSTWYKANGETNEYVNTLWGDLNMHTKEHRYSVGQTKKNRYPVTEVLLTNF